MQEKKHSTLKIWLTMVNLIKKSFLFIKQYWLPQYLADQLTLFQTGRTDYPHLLLLAPPMFFTFRHHWVSSPFFSDLIKDFCTEFSICYLCLFKSFKNSQLLNLLFMYCFCTAFDIVCYLYIFKSYIQSDI